MSRIFGCFNNVWCGKKLSKKKRTQKQDQLCKDNKNKTQCHAPGEFTVSGLIIDHVGSVTCYIKYERYC